MCAAARACTDNALGVVRFELAEGQRRTLRRHAGTDEMLTGTIAPHTNLLAACGYDGIEFWDLDCGAHVGRIEMDSPYWAQFRDRLDGLELAAASGRSVQVWRLESLSSRVAVHVTRLAPIPVPDAIGYAFAGCFSRDGRTLAVVNGQERACVLQLDGLGNEPVIQDNRCDVTSLSPDGRWLATFGNSAGGGVRIWNVHTAAIVATLVSGQKALSAEFSPDGQWLVIDSLSELAFYQVGSWVLHHRQSWKKAVGVPSWSSRLAFAGDGRFLAASRPGYEIKLVRTADGQLLATLPSESPHAWVCLSQDGRWLACAGPDLTIQLWDLASLRRHLERLSLNW